MSLSLQIGSLFSGIGGLDLAAQWAGFETVWFVEKEPFCQKVLAKHWPGVPIHSDIFDCHDLPHVDVIIGGFPCQPFSVAGKRQGANDERFLLPEMMWVIREVKPYAVLFENVPGFPSLNDGAEFKQLLRALAEMGFDAEWGHLRASDFGAPHQRERWFCVAYANRISSRASGASGMGKRTADSFAPSGESSGLGYTSSTRLEGRNRYQPALAELTRPSNGQPESRLGGNTHGLSAGVDFAGWPARPNEPQYDYEPPRVAESAPNRTARLKALGNAVVPQAAYPLMAAIREWLERQGSDEQPV